MREFTSVFKELSWLLAVWKLLDDALGLADQRLARRRGGRIVRHVGKRAVEALQRGAQAADGGAEQIVDLIGVVLQRVELAQTALRGVQLIRGGLAEGAVDSGDHDAGADGRGAIGLRYRFGQIDRFAVVARRAGIRHVIAGDVDRLLKCLQRRDADSKNICHTSSPLSIPLSATGDYL